MAMVFIALGTNLGSRRQILIEACRRLSRIVKVLKASSVHETAPWGFTDQPDFLNQVLLCETNLRPPELLTQLKSIEENLGRTPSFRYGPRLIDLDIIGYDYLILESPSLKIPHPRMHERRFVLAPLVEISPDWVHPYFNKTSLELLAALDIHSDD